METRNSKMDMVVYIILCIVTFGIAAFLRLIISMAIRDAFGNSFDAFQKVK